MTLQYTLQADSTQVIVRIPQAAVSEDLKNMVVFDTSTRNIVSIGKTLADLQSAAPAEWWEKHHATLDSISPFRADTFSPEYALAIIEFFAYKARTPSRLSWLIPTPAVLRRFDYALSIERYEQIALATRQEFEYLLRKSLSARVHSLVINGQPASLQAEFLATKQKKERHTSVAELAFIFFGGAWTTVVFGLIMLVLGPLTMNNPVFQALPKPLLAIVLIIGIFGLVGVAVYSAGFLGSICSIWLLRRFLSVEFLREFFTGHQLLLPRHMRNWLLKNMLGIASHS